MSQYIWEAEPGPMSGAETKSVLPSDVSKTLGRAVLAAGLQGKERGGGWERSVEGSLAPCAARPSVKLRPSKSPRAQIPFVPSKVKG